MEGDNTAKANCQHDKSGEKEDSPMRSGDDSQTCIIPSFSCYLEESEAFNRHLTNLASHTAR